MFKGQKNNTLKFAIWMTHVITPGVNMPLQVSDRLYKWAIDCISEKNRHQPVIPNGYWSKFLVAGCPSTLSRLRWFGHVEHKSGDDWVLACRNVVVAGVRCVGRGRKTWRDCVRDDMEELGLHPEWVVFRDVWRDLISGKTSDPSWAWKNVEETDVLKINGDDDDDDVIAARF